jgi:hypothetical protein
MVVANNEINSNKIYTSNAGNFDGHTDTAVQCGVHRPMERIRGFMQSATMVDDFEKKTLTKHNFYLAFSR